MFDSGPALGGHMVGHRKSFDELATSGAFKRHLSAKFGRQCSMCHGIEWLGQPIPLDLDHKDGNPDDYSEDNLRLLCPNCHRLTPTWGTKNKGNFPGSIRSKVMKQRRG